MAAHQRMTVEEFLALFDADLEYHELIDGRPAPREADTPAHTRIVRRVINALRRQLSGRPWRALSGVPLRIDRWNLLVPDGIVLFQTFDQQRPDSLEPAIVVEVSSGDRQTRDRGEKWPKYSTIETLQHYILIAADEHRIELFSRTGADQWSYKSYHDGLNAVVALSALDICLLPAEIYEGVDLDD